MRVYVNGLLASMASDVTDTFVMQPGLAHLAPPLPGPKR